MHEYLEDYQDKYKNKHTINAIVKSKHGQYVVVILCNLLFPLNGGVIFRYRYDLCIGTQPLDALHK